jgi:bifunctional DNA-binding transcriptional regulator/antitoxin component of YhaV-PrlF toxin-antitoxin module
MTATVQIRSKGTITLPVALRQKYQLEDGKTLSIIDLGEGKILLTAKASQLNKISARIEKKLKEDNVKFDDILGQLDEERKNYNREHYPVQHLS